MESALSPLEFFSRARKLYDSREAVVDGERPRSSANGATDGPPHWLRMRPPIFEVIVVDRRIAIFRIADQRCPATQTVLDGFRCRGAIRNMTALTGGSLDLGFGDGSRAAGTFEGGVATRFKTTARPL